MGERVGINQSVDIKRGSRREWWWFLRSPAFWRQVTLLHLKMRLFEQETLGAPDYVTHFVMLTWNDLEHLGLTLLFLRLS